jgi:hypothetical protein
MSCSTHFYIKILYVTVYCTGARSGAVVEAVRYKPEGRGIYSLGVIGIFH